MVTLENCHGSRKYISGFSEQLYRYQGATDMTRMEFEYVRDKILEGEFVHPIAMQVFGRACWDSGFGIEFDAIELEDETEMALKAHAREWENQWREKLST